MESANLIHYTACPSCGSSQIETALTAVDHTVTHSGFSIMECGICRLRFTQDVPDAATIGPYYRAENYISHTDTSKGLVNRLYHLVRKQTLSDKQHLLEAATRLRVGKLLDVGAGTGAFAAHMQQAGWEVTGLEPDPGARQRAADLYGLSLQPTGDLYELSPDQFDAITLWHVLEHVHSLHEYLEQLKRLLKRGGKLFIAVPNYTAFDARFYGPSWAAYDVPRHLYHFCPDAMVRLLDQHDLMLQVTRPMWYDSFYISMLSDKYAHKRGNMLRAGLVGALSNVRAFVDKSKCSSVIYVAGK